MISQQVPTDQDPHLRVHKTYKGRIELTAITKTGDILRGELRGMEVYLGGHGEEMIKYRTAEPFVALIREFKDLALPGSTIKAWLGPDDDDWRFAKV